jgi:hypothetical protein
MKSPRGRAARAFIWFVIRSRRRGWMQAQNPSKVGQPKLREKMS